MVVHQNRLQNETDVEMLPQIQAGKEQASTQCTTPVSSSLPNGSSKLHDVIDATGRDCQS